MAPEAALLLYREETGASVIGGGPTSGSYEVHWFMLYAAVKYCTRKALHKGRWRFEGNMPALARLTWTPCICPEMIAACVISFLVL